MAEQPKNPFEESLAEEIEAECLLGDTIEATATERCGYGSLGAEVSNPRQMNFAHASRSGY